MNIGVPDQNVKEASYRNQPSRSQELKRLETRRGCHAPGSPHGGPFRGGTATFPFVKPPPPRRVRTRQTRG
eukprot:330649-Prymnesium_polylepis.1